MWKVKNQKKKKIVRSFVCFSGESTARQSAYGFIWPLERDFILFLAAYLLSAMDRTADPCHDFFQYACGSWNRKHVIPEDRSSISTFEVMADQLQVVLKGEF